MTPERFSRLRRIYADDHLVQELCGFTEQLFKLPECGDRSGDEVCHLRQGHRSGHESPSTNGAPWGYRWCDVVSL